MTELPQDLLEMIARDPREFLRRNHRIEEQIQIKQKRIEHIWSVSVSITQALKPVTVYTGPGDKIGDGAIALTALQEEIREDVAGLERIQRETELAIRSLVKDQTLRMILEAYYLSGLRWEEIACAMHYAYRWVLRLHKRGLSQMKAEAQNLCEASKIV